MAATYDVTTDRGKVRLMIGDTDVTPATDAHYTDAEIDAFLTMASGSLLLAASYALEAWAAILSGDLSSEKIGDYAYTKKVVENKTALAKKYRDEDASTPYMTWAEPDFTHGSGITREED